MPDGLVVKALTHEAELRAALTDRRRFARGVQHWKALREGRVDPAHPMAQMMAIDSLLVYDGQHHTSRRKMLAAGFSPAAMRALKPAVEQVIAHQLDALADTPQPIDLKRDFAFGVTVRVLAALVGLDLTRTPQVADLIRASMAGTGAGTTDQVRQAIAGLVTDKRHSPDERIVSTLIAARDEDGDALSDAELVDTVMLLISAGYETTMGALVNIARALLTHPAQLAALRKGRLSWEQVIDEGMRVDGPVSVLSWLFATEDVHYANGSVIEAGDAVLMCYLAANRDPARHGPTAREFAPEQPRFPHIAFGLGPHHCLGRPLARMELEIALPALFDRFPDLRLAEAPVRPEPSVVMNHPQQLLAYTHTPSSTPAAPTGNG